MAGSVNISNRALIMLGAKPIVSFDDGTTEAIALNTIYDTAKLQLLRSYPWRCATCITTPALTRDAPVDPEWEYAFCWPEDCLRVLKVIDKGYANDPKPKWISVGKFIYTRCKNIAIWYIVDLPEPRFDVMLDEVFVLKLASELAYTLTASDSRANTMYQMYEKKLHEAQTADRQEGTHVELYMDTLTIVR